MTERDFEKLVERMADVHNDPPPTPRERMWRQVEARRTRTSPKRRIPRTFWAVAAVLLLGIGLGRWSSPPRDAGPVAVAVPRTPEALPELYQQSTLALFNKADALLTDFRLSGCDAGEMDPTHEWATRMLRQARLLQGTPVGQNAELEGLLMDLELVLAQIVAINPENCDRDVAWIRSGLTQRATLDRLRAVTDRSTALDAI